MVTTDKIRTPMLTRKLGGGQRGQNTQQMSLVINYHPVHTPRTINKIWATVHPRLYGQLNSSLHAYFGAEAQAEQGRAVDDIVVSEVFTLALCRLDAEFSTVTDKRWGEYHRYYKLVQGSPLNDLDTDQRAQLGRWATKHIQPTGRDVIDMTTTLDRANAAMGFTVTPDQLRATVYSNQLNLLLKGSAIDVFDRLKARVDVTTPAQSYLKWGSGVSNKILAATALRHLELACENGLEPLT